MEDPERASSSSTSRDRDRDSSNRKHATSSNNCSNNSGSSYRQHQNNASENSLNTQKHLLNTPFRSFPLVTSVRNSPYRHFLVSFPLVAVVVVLTLFHQTGSIEREYTEKLSSNPGATTVPTTGPLRVVTPTDHSIFHNRKIRRERTGKLNSVFVYDKKASQNCTAANKFAQRINVTFSEATKLMLNHNNGLCRDFARDCPIQFAPVKSVRDSAQVKNVRGCFVFLASEIGFIERLQNLLPSLQKFYFDIHGESDIIIFHTGIHDMVAFAALKDKLRKMTKARMRYVDITEVWKYPSYIDYKIYHGGLCNGPDYPWPKNYLIMNIFFMYKMFQEPILGEYDYYIRCDTDVLLKYPVPINFWEFMLEGQLDFVSTDRLFEVKGCYEGLFNVTIDYGLKHFPSEMTPERLAFFDFFGERSSFCGHFNIGNLEFFRSKEYQAFAKYIVMDLRGLYTNRWSDQILYPLAMALFSNRTRVRRFGWFDGLCHYHHDAPVYGLDDTHYGNPYADKSEQT